MIPHPGKILYSDFLKPQKISLYRLAQELQINAPRVCEIVRGNRAITTNTAIRLSRYFGNNPEFWLQLQMRFNIAQELKKTKKHQNR